MEKYDVGIIGSGLSGVATAIYLAEARPDLKIALITKSGLYSGNSYFAQGGIAAVMDLLNDSFEKHVQDTLNSGGGLSDPEIVEMVVRSAPGCINQLEKWGVNFDHKDNTAYEVGLEGGHSASRILHVADNTGSSIMSRLVEKLHSLTTIDVWENNVCYALSVNCQGAVNGFQTFDTNQKVNRGFHCKYVILGTGGCGHVFKYTTNPASSIGDGVFLAKQIGALITNMRFVQFHPTALKSARNEQLFLISEAVRGFGAHLVNKKHERFVFKTDKRGELATRDIVSKAMFDLLRSDQNEEIYLDCRHLNEASFADHFPMIYAHLKELHFNIKEDLIPVVPAAHYQCGGIRVNEAGQTSVDRLYAIGECSDSGLHGKNRLASNSLLEAIVFAFNSSQNILNSVDSDEFLDSPDVNQIKMTSELGTFYTKLTEMTKEVMTTYFNIGSSEKEMQVGMKKLNELCGLIRGNKENATIGLDEFRSNVILELAKEIARDHLKEIRSKNLHHKETKLSEK